MNIETPRETYDHILNNAVYGDALKIPRFRALASAHACVTADDGNYFAIFKAKNPGSAPYAYDYLVIGVSVSESGELQDVIHKKEWCSYAEAILSMTQVMITDHGYAFL